jgi:hypothetical protein
MLLDAVGCCFALLRRVYWPALEEYYGNSKVIDSKIQKCTATDT